MKAPQFIQALQHTSALDVWIKITAVCRARGVTTLSFLSVVLLSAIVTAPSRLAAQATRPNIVVIMTDDQRLDDLRVLTKTSRLIGDQGTTFRNFYCSSPLCAPSRATFLTGQYAHNHGVFSNDYSNFKAENALPVWLQEAGYFTSHIGKYLHRFPTRAEIPPGWSHWQVIAGNAFRMYNYVINDNGTLITYGGSEEDYQTDVIADRAVDTITEALSSQPFFLSIAPVAPHINSGLAIEPPRNPEPAPRDMDAFLNEPLPKPPSYNELDVSDKPAEIRNMSLISPDEEQEITDRYRARLASLLAVDDLVERVVDALADTGVLNNTVLIFTSDNGFFQGEHRIKHGKFSLYEEAVHMPLLIRGPGFPQGATRTPFVANLDLAPTIVELAGANAGLAMDGRSLLSLKRVRSLGAERDLLIETRPDQAVRNKSFFYVEHDTGEQELYDMRKGTANYDPYQLQSQHADPAYADVKAQLAAKLNQLRTCSGISCEVQ
jgi:N-acetylglucosamine-6-sulfatase